MWNIWPFGRKSEPAEQRSMTIDEFLAMAGIPNTGSGEYVSAGTAESLPAVMNAVSVISEAVATMPCYLYRVRNDNGREAREWLSNHPVDFLLNEQPNDCQTPYQFKRTMMRHCLLNGNAYAVIQWGRDGQPQSLHPYAPGRLFLSVSASISTNTPSLSRLPGLCAPTCRKRFCTCVTPPMMVFWGARRSPSAVRRWG
jgi:phage portal protein BeeE